MLVLVVSIAQALRDIKILGLTIYPMFLCSACNNAQVLIYQPATHPMFYDNKGRLIGSGVSL